MKESKPQPTPMGRPRKYQTPEQMQEAIDRYFVERGSKAPTYESLAVALDIDTDTLLNYEKKEGYEDFFGTVKKAKMRVVSGFIDYCMDANNKMAGGFPVFLLKNYGYSDRQELAVTDQTFEIEF